MCRSFSSPPSSVRKRARVFHCPGSNKKKRITPALLSIVTLSVCTSFKTADWHFSILLKPMSTMRAIVHCRITIDSIKKLRGRERVIFVVVKKCHYRDTELAWGRDKPIEVLLNPVVRGRCLVLKRLHLNTEEKEQFSYFVSRIIIKSVSTVQPKFLYVFST